MSSFDDLFRTNGTFRGKLAISLNFLDKTTKLKLCTIIEVKHNNVRIIKWFDKFRFNSLNSKILS